MEGKSVLSVENRVWMTVAEETFGDDKMSGRQRSFKLGFLPTEPIFRNQTVLSAENRIWVTVAD